MDHRVVEIKHRIISGSLPGPRLLIAAGVHGDEYEPMVCVRELCTRCQSIPLRGSLILAPVVNESAFARRSRVAEDGLDLARTCPGKADGTVTEQIADSFSSLIRSATHLIDLHTGGAAYKIIPLAGYMLHQDEAVLHTQRRMAGAFDLPLIWGTSGKLNGRSLSVARDSGIPAIYTEFGGGGGCDRKIIESYIAGCLNVMRELGLIDGAQPSSAVREMVEDSRDGAGVLQSNHPASFGGFFQPTIALGDHVRAGDSIGTISNSLGEEIHTVPAERTGIILMLRALPSVARGEALAAILPDDAPRRKSFL